ncbi:MAG: HpcH/HpaI aldolase family protein [Alphaproteobacteria bacterium]
MRENRVRTIWKEGGAVVNGWLSIPNGMPAEFMAHQGWDSLTIDLQHGIVDYQAAVGMLQAISTTAVTPLVRVPWNEPGIIQKLLDAGAYGVICPMINSRAECEQFVGACRYPPRGYRSWGPLRGLVYGGPDYAKEANGTILALAMIETEQAIRNMDEIMSVPGLDGVYIGPSDLAISMGFPPGFDPTEPKLVDAFKTIVAAAKRHGIAAGIHVGSVGYALKMIKEGYRFVSLLSELRLMSWVAKNAVAAVKAGQATPGAP